MNLTLRRTDYRVDGIFSELLGEMGGVIAVTLEHSYPSSTGFSPKIPPGTYICRRGVHQLHSSATPFETFEITGVVGHSNLLFHPGNKNEDSEGCVLTGTYVERWGDSWVIAKSRDAFTLLMGIQAGLDEFPLTVLA